MAVFTPEIWEATQYPGFEVPGACATFASDNHHVRNSHAELAIGPVVSGPCANVHAT